ncbi:MAG: alpha-amylase/4-alpha-glucanotransferase domain-containing protein [Anaerolineae bacterium]
MSVPFYLMLVFHNHQPVGQFDHVVEHSVNVSYLPLIELLEQHPTIRVAMHYSGPLLDWLKQHHGEIVERLQRLVTRKQVELLSGGYYDPVLAVLPDEDKVGQVQKMTAEVQATFGCEVAGAWLAERVWEPHLARPIAEAGIKYVIVDDTHFESVGFDRDGDLFGYYLTEDQVFPLPYFPSLTRLRYSIPWETVDVAIEWLREQASQPLTSNQPKIALMGDDGEKFGTWPQTYEHCWGDGKYMESLFTALEHNSDWLQTTTPSQYLAKYPPLGRAYLPSASYMEMGVWSLPTEMSHNLDRLLQAMNNANRSDVTRFMRGGLWRGFMVKYDEVNHMHKRMLFVSRKIHDMRRGRKRDMALDLLWSSQSNDPYWHGLFGGIYLFNFRVANYAGLLAAENAVSDHESPIQLTRADLDLDGYEDVIISGWPLNSYWSPARGGALFELDYRPAHYNLANVMTRQREAYHIELVEAAADNTLITPLSPHQEPESSRSKVVRAKEAGLEHLLIYDWHRHGSFIDHFIAPSTTLNEFYHAQYAEQGDFINQPYEVLNATCNEAEAILRLQRRGQVWIGEVRRDVIVHKTAYQQQHSPALRVVYNLSHNADQAVDLRFGVETVVGFDGGQDLHYCALHINDAHERLLLNAIREFEAITRYTADTNLRNLTLRTEISRPCFLWQYPLETISLSEAGFERGYQGTVFLHLWNIHLAPGETWQVTITQSVQQMATRN